MKGPSPHLVQSCNIAIFLVFYLASYVAKCIRLSHTRFHTKYVATELDAQMDCQGGASHHGGTYKLKLAPFHLSDLYIYRGIG